MNILKEELISNSKDVFKMLALNVVKETDNTLVAESIYDNESIKQVVTVKFFQEGEKTKIFWDMRDVHESGRFFRSHLYDEWREMYFEGLQNIQLVETMWGETVSENFRKLEFKS